MADNTTELSPGVSSDLTATPLDSSGVRPIDTSLSHLAPKKPPQAPEVASGENVVTHVERSESDANPIPLPDPTPPEPKRTQEQMKNWPMSEVQKQHENVITGPYTDIVDPATGKKVIQDLGPLPQPAAVTTSVATEQPPAPPAPVAEVAPATRVSKWRSLLHRFSRSR